MAMAELLTITDVARRSGVASSALRFYEDRGLIASERAGSGHRRYPRAVLRRIAFIVFAQKIGLSLDEIGAELSKLPHNRVPERADWARLSADWTRRVDRADRGAAAVEGRADAVHRLRMSVPAAVPARQPGGSRRPGRAGTAVLDWEGEARHPQLRALKARPVRHSPSPQVGRRCQTRWYSARFGRSWPRLPHKVRHAPTCPDVRRPPVRPGARVARRRLRRRGDGTPGAGKAGRRSGDVRSLGAAAGRLQPLRQRHLDQEHRNSTGPLVVGLVSGALREERRGAAADHRLGHEDAAEAGLHRAAGRRRVSRVHGHGAHRGPRYRAAGQRAEVDCRAHGAG